jgi:methionyl-tRNA formyltransferase
VTRAAQMRIVFAGTPAFASAAFEALRHAGHDIRLVLTQPDRPAGRGMKILPSAVKQAALAAGVEVAQPRSLRLDGRYPEEAAAARDKLLAIAPDVMVVAAYGLILPRWTLELPRLGCLNIHASLLPRWRGAAPIQRAIEAGDSQTGITIMQMDEGLDTGDRLLEHVVPIGSEDTAAQLHDALALAGAESIVRALARLAAGDLTPEPQPEVGVTYAAKLEKVESALDFSQPAELLARRVRAFNPVPGATVRLAGLPDPVKVWRAQVLADPDSAAAPGTVVNVSASGIDIQASPGILRLLELQKAGAKRLAVALFVKGWQP